MPVPQPAEQATPRRLLRDVVFEKMVDAILDGTLVPGERLNDDELVRWLAVSRTPIREAIARLHAWGLVEMEANRYTRVSAIDPVIYSEASQFLSGLHHLAIDWSRDAPSVDKKAVAGTLFSAQEKVTRRDRDGVLDLLDAYAGLVALTGNTLLIEAELPLRTRVKFLTPADTDAVDWAAINDAAAALDKAAS